MLSGMPRSERAICVNVEIMRAFVRLVTLIFDTGAEAHSAARKRIGAVVALWQRLYAVQTGIVWGC